jgi:hypothetical protein
MQSLLRHRSHHDLLGAPASHSGKRMKRQEFNILAKFQARQPAGRQPGGTPAVPLVLPRASL